MTPTRLNLGSGIYHLDHFDNLDKETGWRFEDGLGQYPDGSVEGISVAHAAMYVELPDWPAMFAEFYRVLKPGGVIRITEDNTTDPKSERFGGWHDARTLTDARLVCDYLTLAGFEAHKVNAKTTFFVDRSLCQSLHGPEPKVFFVEGIKPARPNGDRADDRPANPDPNGAVDPPAVEDPRRR